MSLTYKKLFDFISSQYEVWYKARKIKEIPSWDDYFMMNAFIASSRSPDAETQHGCVIVKDKRQIGMGYNGFSRGLDDAVLPNTRPDKYPWMQHGEINAILNCLVSPIGSTAYITGEPCFNCSNFMWQAGITEIVHADFNHAKMTQNDEYTRNMTIFKYQTRHHLKFRIYRPSIKHVEDMLTKIKGQLNGTS